MSEIKSQLSNLPSPETRTILLIDDDTVVHSLMRRTLTRAGYKVEMAANGIDGLHLARELRPDIIILDIQMPNMDGWTVLTNLKADPVLAGIPVVIASMIDEKNRGLGLGASEYLLKPLDRNRLLNILQSLRKEATLPPVEAAPKQAAYVKPERSIETPRQGRILVVEDDMANRTVLVRTLRKDGWEVQEATNGMEALAAVTEKLPDMILLDLMLPYLNGFGFLSELHALPGGAEIPIIAISAKDLSREERTLLGKATRRAFQKGSYTRSELLAEIRTGLPGRTSNSSHSTAS